MTGWKICVGMLGICAGTLRAAPAIQAGGVVNAASFRVSGVPGGGLAQGSLATVFGSGLGPAQGVSANTFPLGTTLSGVSVRLTQGSSNIDALPVFAIAGQVNFLVPSTTPLGAVDVRVSYNGETSAPATVQIVSSALGLFTFSASGSTQRAVVQNYVSATATPVNLPDTSAKPGQTLIAYGTGLGPIAAPDNAAAPGGDVALPVDILVGGVPARRIYAGRSPCCAGLDQIVFELPANTPLGCTVPLVILAGGVYSNLGDISVARDGGVCAAPVAAGDGTRICYDGSLGTFFFVETYSQGFLSVPGLSPDIIVNSGSGYFVKLSGCATVPSFGWGSCMVSTKRVNASSSTPTPQPAPVPPPSTLTITYLDAGPTLTLTGPGGTKQLIRTAGPAYSSSPVLPTTPFFTSGAYTIAGPGGRDVGAFSSTLIYSPIRVTSPTPGTVNMSQPPTIAWSGGEYARDMMVVSVTLVDATYVSSVSCTIAGGRAGTFTIPSWVWSQIPTFTSGLAYISASGGSYLDQQVVKVAGLDNGLGLNIVTSHQIQATIGK